LDVAEAIEEVSGFLSCVGGVSGIRFHGAAHGRNWHRLGGLLSGRGLGWRVPEGSLGACALDGGPAFEDLPKNLIELYPGFATARRGWGNTASRRVGFGGLILAVR
jgi:hypothetical protein